MAIPESLLIKRIGYKKGISFGLATFTFYNKFNHRVYRYAAYVSN